MTQPMRPLATVAIAALVWTCSDGGGPDPQPTPVPTTVTLSQTSVALTSLGATAQLTATVKDQNGNTMSGASVTWSSNDMAVASVSGTGTVTAVSVGTAQITATAGSASGSATITVTQQPAMADPVDGSGQTGTVGDVLPTPLVVQINDDGGNPIPDVTVTFAVTQGSGTVSDPTVTTGAEGMASTVWTLGTDAGEQEVTASVSGGAVAGTFTATATPDVPDSMLASSGDGQQGPTGAKLSLPIAVAVVDRYGNGVPGQDVAFSVTGGGGTLDNASVMTDGDGIAVNGWTLGAAEGLNVAEATVAGLKGSPVVFGATATNLSATGVSPDPMVEGAMATITGTGFNLTPANNGVTIGGVAATVTSATETTLDVVVPTFDCRPARMVDVVVTVSGISTTPLSHEVNPESFVTTAVGEQTIIRDPSEFCLQFAETNADETYLVGVTHVSEVVGARTGVTLTSVTSTGSTAPARVSTPWRAARSAQILGTDAVRRIERLERHRAVKAQLLAEQLRALQGLPMRPASGALRSVPPDVQVGDTVPIRWVDRDGDRCDDFTPINTVARVIGTRGVWLEDLANDTAGFSIADFQQFSDELDELIYDRNVEYFGAPTDLDGNNRLVVVVTKEVNKVHGILGTVPGTDFFPQTTCAASDEGEIFYAIAPDSNTSVAFLKQEYAPLIAHEFVHIQQLGRRIAANASTFPSVWELEGQATFGETQVGIIAQGLAPRDIPNSIVFDFPDTASADWHSSMFIDVAKYFGLDLTTSPPGRLAEAPWDCTWQDRNVEDDECTLDGREVYGVPASFLWWLSDQFGPTFMGGVGGVQGIQQAIIDNSNLSGFANLSTIIGIPIDSLLVQWQAALMLDNRELSPGVPIPLTPRLTFKTWNIFSILDRTQTSSGTSLAPTPKVLGFADSSLTVNVRGGSTGYFAFLSEGMGRPATAVRVRDSGDGTLPPNMRLWVARGN